MNWEFSEDLAFEALQKAFHESGEVSAVEFFAKWEGAFHYQELMQNAAGEGIDLSDSKLMEELKESVIEILEDSLKNRKVKH